jgi:Fe-S cluster biogenesis protein NfuA
MCHGCPSAGATLKNVVEKELKERIDPAIEIEAE